MVELDLMGNLRDLNVASVFLRLALAMLFGGTIGFERGIRQRAAGLRTHMLLCVGSASTMLCSQFLYASYGVGDPARLSAHQRHRLPGGGHHHRHQAQRDQGTDHGGYPLDHRLYGHCSGRGLL